MKSFEWKRSVMSLAIVLVAYSIYVLAIVPWIEPSLRRQEAVAPGSSSYEVRSTDRFQQQLKQWFPADSWEMRQPNVLHSQGMTVLFEDYRPNEDGTVHIHPCTVVYVQDQDPVDSRNASPLILQAPDGALLQLNRPLDLRSGQVGQPVEGRLLGKIRIHSPGTEDGRGRLNILTSNVQIKPQRLWTPHEVLVEFDNSTARGQDLMVKLVPGQWNGAQRDPTGMGGIRSLELVRLEHLHLEIESPESSPQESRDGEESVAVPTVDVDCRGPFRIDFAQKVATFEDEVSLRRREPGGVEDTLRCEVLSLFLDPVKTAEPSTSPEDADPQKVKVPRWTVRQVVAEGNPAELNVASRKAWVRGRKLLYDLQQRRFRLWSSEQDPNDQVQLRQDQHEVQARDLDCQLAEDRSIQQLTATGPGRYQGVLSGDNLESVQASWGGKLALQRDGEDQVLSLHRSVQVQLGASRTIEAGEMHLWLESAPRVLLDGGDAPGDLRPKRLLALVHADGESAQAVRIRSPELSGQTARLEALFHHRPPQAVSRIRPVSTTRREPQARIRGIQPNPVASPSPSRELEVEGQSVNVVFVLHGREIAVQQVALRGQAQLRQRDAQQPEAESFFLFADAVDVQDLNGQGGHYVVASGRPVRIQTDRLTLQSDQLQLDRVQNRLWTEGPGRATIRVDRDLQGRPLSETQSMTVDWRRQMDFDGATIRFAGDIQVVGEMQRMRAEQLAVGLNRRVDFTAPQPRNGELQIRKIQADGNVLVESRELIDGQQQSTSYLQVPHLQVDQQTGDAQASGPGRMVVIRKGFAQGLTMPGQTSPAPAEVDSRLTFVQIDFQRQLQGDLRRHVVEFRDRVQVLYGPIQSWNETLQVHATLGPDQVLLNCDQLTLAEGTLLPNGKRSVTMAALGNAYVEGESFTARGERVSYEQAKDLLVLEGTTRVDAVLSHQARVGSRRSEHAARKILYWPQSQRVEVDDARYLDLSNLGGAAWSGDRSGAGSPTSRGR